MSHREVPKASANAPTLADACPAPPVLTVDTVGLVLAAVLLLETLLVFDAVDGLALEISV